MGLATKRHEVEIDLAINHLADPEKVNLISEILALVIVRFD